MAKLIYETYCSKKLCLMLKEKGINAQFKQAYYDPDEDGYKRHYCKYSHAIAMKWLREQKGIFFCIHPDYPVAKEKYIIEFYNNGEPSGLLGNYITYEDAIEAALEYSLEYLI